MSIDMNKLSTKDYHVSLQKINTDLFCWNIYQKKYLEKGTLKFSKSVKRRNYLRDIKRYIVYVLRKRSSYKRYYVNPKTIGNVRY
jgi:hypothetical protein